MFPYSGIRSKSSRIDTGDSFYISVKIAHEIDLIEFLVGEYFYLIEPGVELPGSNKMEIIPQLVADAVLSGWEATNNKPLVAKYLIGNGHRDRHCR